MQRLSSAGAQISRTSRTSGSRRWARTATRRSASRPARDGDGDLPPAARPVLRHLGGGQRLPGMVDNEFERYGQALEAAGRGRRRRHAALDQRRRRQRDAAAEDGATAASATRRAWLHVWEADDNRPPLADNEDELFGRLAGDDGDLDGVIAPADCNDADAVDPSRRDRRDRQRHRRRLFGCGHGEPRPRRRRLGPSRRLQRREPLGPPGRRRRRPTTRVDEDCSGADAVNFDRDRDGSLRPVDCNDANAAIRPGARDIPRNRVDEDCSGKDAAFPNLGANVSNAWDVDGAQLQAAHAGRSHSSSRRA